MFLSSIQNREVARMEGLKIRAVIACTALVIAGVFVTFVHRMAVDPKTEDWMIENSPMEISGFTMQSGSDSPLYSYKMGESTYNVLEPYGIVARIYEDNVSSQQFDVVLIASRSKESFHDPRVCFSAQGYSISNQWKDKVETKTRGSVPLTIAIMDTPDRKDQIAAYLYKGPDGFYANTQRLKMAMLIEQLKGGSNLDGVFYRIIPLTNQTDQIQQINDLKKFVAQYLDRANEASQGFF